MIWSLVELLCLLSKLIDYQLFWLLVLYASLSYKSLFLCFLYSLISLGKNVGRCADSFLPSRYLVIFSCCTFRVASNSYPLTMLGLFSSFILILQRGRDSLCFFGVWSLKASFTPPTTFSLFI